jgi:hypothetical protein
MGLGRPEGFTADLLALVTDAVGQWIAGMLAALSSGELVYGRRNWCA